MIISRTHEYNKHIAKQPKRFVYNTNFLEIKKSLSQTDNLLCTLKMASKRANLPFSKKTNHTDMKLELNHKILNMENMIKEEKNSHLRSVLSNRLQDTIIDYRHELQNELEHGQYVYEEIAYVGEKEKLKKNMYFLTTMLMELKCVVMAQNEKLDRIEEYMVMSYENIQKTNEILVDVKNRKNSIKDRIIYILCVIVILMMSCAVLKVSKRKHLV